MSLPAFADPPAHDWPLYWFAALERAIDDGDFAVAAQATQELRRLGVDVTYRRKRQHCEKGEASYA